MSSQILSISNALMWCVEPDRSLIGTSYIVVWCSWTSLMVTSSKVTGTPWRLCFLAYVLETSDIWLPLSQKTTISSWFERTVWNRSSVCCCRWSPIWRWNCSPTTVHPWIKREWYLLQLSTPHGSNELLRGQSTPGCVTDKQRGHASLSFTSWQRSTNVIDLNFSHFLVKCLPLGWMRQRLRGWLLMRELLVPRWFICFLVPRLSFSFSCSPGFTLNTLSTLLLSLFRNSIKLMNLS